MKKISHCLSFFLSNPWTINSLKYDQLWGKNVDTNQLNISEMIIPPRLTIARATRLLHSNLTSKQLCAHSLNLAHFGEKELRLNAYTKLLSAEDIAEQAAESDDRIKNGKPKSFLDGIPVTIKANIAVGKWWELPTACSAILNNMNMTNRSDDVYESDVARKLLKECGAVLIGITNMDEFGMGSLGANIVNRESSSAGHDCRPTINPLPWMQQIATFLGSFTTTTDLDDFFSRQILESTVCNPHGLKDDALQQLVDEVSNSMFSNKWTEKHQSPLLSPGGSSSGAAVAIAHGSSLLSIGTDTGGSLRLPAAWTSTVGFKPTYGSISRYGVTSYASSLDTVGFVAGTADCAEIAWKCLSHSNQEVCRDSTATIYHKSYILPKSAEESNETSLKGIRIGIPSAFSLHESPSLISSTWHQGANLLQSKGATLVSIPESKVSPLWVKLSCAAYYVLACAEASSNLSRYDGIRYGVDCRKEENDATISDDLKELSDMSVLEQQISGTRVHGFGDEVQRRVLAGTSVLSSDRFHTHYESAARVRAKISSSFENVFRNSDGNSDYVDVVLVPTALSFPVPFDSVKGNELDPTSAFANDVMTIPISLGGFPSVSVPFSKNVNSADADAKKVVGLQIFGSRGSENLVLRVAKYLKR